MNTFPKMININSYGIPHDTEMMISNSIKIGKIWNLMIHFNIEFQMRSIFIIFKWPLGWNSLIHFNMILSLVKCKFVDEFQQNCSVKCKLNQLKQDTIPLEKELASQGFEKPIQDYPRIILSFHHSTRKFVKYC